MGGWTDGLMDWRCGVQLGHRLTGDIDNCTQADGSNYQHSSIFLRLFHLSKHLCWRGEIKEIKTGPALQPETLRMENEDAGLSNGFTTIALNAEGTLKLRRVALVCWSQSISVNKWVMMPLHRRCFDLSPIKRHFLLLDKKLILGESAQDDEWVYSQIATCDFYQTTSLEPPSPSATPLNHNHLINQEERYRLRHFLLC